MSCFGPWHAAWSDRFRKRSSVVEGVLGPKGPFGLHDRRIGRALVGSKGGGVKFALCVVRVLTVTGCQRPGRTEHSMVDKTLDVRFGPPKRISLRAARNPSGLQPNKSGRRPRYGCSALKTE